MFPYTDPVLTGVLESNGALETYRELVDAVYQFAATDQNAFEMLDRIEASSPVEFIEWSAFPVTANVDDAVIDLDRLTFQDEYVEWRVERDTRGDVAQVTFTTEFSEYYEALAEIGEAALVAGIQGAIPDANPSTEELFGAGFDPANASASARAESFRKQNVVPFNSSAPEVKNPWNNNEKGILCLAQRFNTLGALFNLAKECSVPNASIPSTGQCAAVSPACASNRNSDPQICARSQDVARIPRVLSLQDPVGVVIRSLNGTWRAGDTLIDINDPATNRGMWSVSRNGRRASLKVQDGLTVDNDRIDTGTQISRLLTVGSQVISSASPSSSRPRGRSVKARNVRLLTRAL